MTEIVKNLLIKNFFTLYLNDTPYDGWTDRQTKFSISTEITLLRCFNMGLAAWTLYDFFLLNTDFSDEFIPHFKTYLIQIPGVSKWKERYTLYMWRTKIFQTDRKWVETDRLIFYSECAENLLIIKWILKVQRKRGKLCNG